MTKPDDDGPSLGQYLLDATWEIHHELCKFEEQVALVLRQVRIAAEREVKKLAEVAAADESVDDNNN